MIEIKGNNEADRSTWIKELLREGVYDVTFTKVNGEVRTMPCTLRADLLPPPPAHTTNTNNPVDFPKVKKENLAVVSVWCLDKNEWRSFRAMNITEVKPVPTL